MSALRCAYCHALDWQPMLACPQCGTLLHPECARDLRVCPTLGCRGRPVGCPHIDRPLGRVGAWAFDAGTWLLARLAGAEQRGRGLRG